MTSNNITQLKGLLIAEENHLEDIKSQLKDTENAINHIKQMIYNICEHKWVIDSSSYNEHPEYVCTDCGLGTV